MEVMTADTSVPSLRAHDASLSDTWNAIENVWQRLSKFMALDVNTESDSSQRTGAGEGSALWARDFKTRAVGPLRELRLAAIDADLYQTRPGGRLMPIVQRIEYRGDDLVLTFTPLRVIRRWEEGEDVALQIQAFLARVSRLSCLSTAHQFQLTGAAHD